MSRNAIVILSAALAAIFSATAAFAHAQLDHASPGVGAEVAAPNQLLLAFTEAIEPKFSSVTLASTSGEAEPLGPLSVDPANAAIVLVKVAKPLPPGVYTVKWKATSVDTHKTQGSYNFTVKP
jgi:methionine-rich copper-binding protein CopC